MIIGTRGAVVGEVVTIDPHPNAEKIWLSTVRVGDGRNDVRIVFGGLRTLQPGDLVPVALPGTHVRVAGRDKQKKMRTRSFRGERSHGMLCSLRELGWVAACVDEVAVLKGLPPGWCLDDVPPGARRDHVVNWTDVEEPCSL